MFERYTEKARWIIFFARYEASQFGSRHIESEHLLLGLLRKDTRLASHFFDSLEKIESVRKEIEARAPKAAVLSTSVDLPLSSESKRILAYAAEESERLRHKHIGSPHLLLGILRESEGFAARLLSNRGIDLEAARAYAAEVRMYAGEWFAGARTELPAPPRLLLEMLWEREKEGGISVALNDTVAGHPADIAVYEGDDVMTGRQSTQLRRRIRFCSAQMEAAVARHDFDKARFYSTEERRLRDELAKLHGGVPEAADLSSPEEAPFLCILMIPADESLSGLRSLVDAFFAAGVPHVWMLDVAQKRAYTATPAEGLREMTSDTLQVNRPSLQIEWRRTLG